MTASPQRVPLKNIKIMITEKEINNKNITNDLGWCNVWQRGHWCVLLTACTSFTEGSKRVYGRA